MQDALNLTLPQQLAFVSARQSLLNKLQSIRQQREKVIFALGLAMLQTAPVSTSLDPIPSLPDLTDTRLDGSSC